MKILVLSALFLEDELRELGHDVKTCSFLTPGDYFPENTPCAIEEVLDGLGPGWVPDVIMLGDESLLPLFLGLEFLEIPLVWYAIDNHIQHHWQPQYAAAFDVIFVAQKDYLTSYRSDPSRQIIEWLPPFTTHTLPLPPPFRPHDLSFVGTLDPRTNPARVALLEQLQNQIPVYVSSGRYIEVFHRSKMVLNQCAAGDLNFRTFQVMACGSLLLMERIGNGLEELFQDRTHLVLYERSHIDEIIDHVRYYSDHESERAQISAQGYAEVMARHTARHRAERILDVLQTAPLDDMVHKRISKLTHIQEELRSVYNTGAGVYRLLAKNQDGENQKSYTQTAACYEEISRTIGDHLRRMS